jgi:lysophospholipid acyltransferase (LPLAT)-like uncharacterized protein
VEIFVHDGTALKQFSDGTGSDTLSAELLSSPTALLPLWNAHSLLLISSYLSSPLIAQAARRFEAVADDSFGGEFTQYLYRRILLAGRRLSIRSPESRLEDLREILDKTPPIVMAVDSHGPYREISAGMARLARSYDGLIRPVATACDRAIYLFPKIKMAFPRRHSRIVVVFGSRLQQAGSISSTRVTLRDTLAGLEKQARTLLHRGNPVAA